MKTRLVVVSIISIFALTLTFATFASASGPYIIDVQQNIDMCNGTFPQGFFTGSWDTATYVWTVNTWGFPYYDYYNAAGQGCINPSFTAIGFQACIYPQTECTTFAPNQNTWVCDYSSSCTQAFNLAALISEAEACGCSPSGMTVIFSAVVKYGSYWDFNLNFVTISSGEYPIT